MAVTVRKAVLWRKEIENRPGVLATTLALLARARADLKVVMGYRFPGMQSQGSVRQYYGRGVELEPVPIYRPRKR